MSRPPALIFVIRHGSRLDVADKKWHLTSPTPYDPPLSYGGWMQSKALGVKIGALIQQIDSESGAEITNSQPKQQKKQKNYNIVIHSSPYLRCIQTSIAISAGLAQTSTNKVSSSPATTGTSPSNSPPALVMPSPALKPTDKLQPGPETAKTSRIRKTLLRLDAFLGEWLCPEYFELITPPPSSALMLAGAKAELLRREDFMTYPPVTTRHHSNSSSGKLWSSPLSSPADQLPDVDIPGGLETVPALNDALPDNIESPGARKNSGQKVRFVTNVTSSPIAATEGSAGYVAPTPHYAISHSGKIPEGYVYHAKDACVTVDYQWDSMRAPLEWGDGGSFGEEWASMHRRFRKGVQHLVDWYAATENPAEVTGRSRPSSTVEPGLMYEDGADNEVENVVIIVSHGAGCNAIIGAITHQPVLMEVGMASLTMAMRKPVKDMVFTTAAPAGDETDETASVASNKGSVPVHHHYDLKIFANMEHIRPTSANSRHHTRPEVPQSASRGRMPNFSMSPTKPSPYTYTEGFNRNESRSNSANSALGSMRRSMVPPSWSLPRPPAVGPGGGTGGSGSFTGDHHAAHAPSPISTGLSRSPSIGLWSPATSRLNVSQEPDDDEDDMFPDFDHKKKFAPVRRNTKDSIGSAKSADLSGGKTAKSPAVAPIQIPSATGAPTGEEADSANAVATPTSQPSSQPSSAGLWGSPQTTESPPVRDLSASKRRWTTNERS